MPNTQPTNSVTATKNNNTNISKVQNVLNQTESEVLSLNSQYWLTGYSLQVENLPMADVDTQTSGRCLALTIASTSCLLVSTLLLTRLFLNDSLHLYKVQ